MIPAALHSRVSYHFRVMRGSKQTAKGECGLSAFQLQAIPSVLDVHDLHVWTLVGDKMLVVVVPRFAPTVTA